MKLEKISTVPKKLFDDVEFKDGLNIIFAHKTNDDVEPGLPFDENRESLHALGKSTLLDLILFALLFELKSLPRLQNAYNNKILHGISIVLDFSINKKHYYIKRSFDNPNKNIYFGKPGEGKPWTLNKLREEIFRLVFFRDEYLGINNPNWYFKLFSFFIKVKKREELFSDPIEFSPNLSELDRTPFHLYLLDIDNSILIKHKEILESINHKNSYIYEIEDYLLDKNNTKDIGKVLNKQTGLINDVNKIKKRISDFSLSDDYSELQKDADDLTSKIKKLWFNNAVDKKKIDDLTVYKKSAAIEITENVPAISAIYSDVNKLLGSNIKTTLDQVVKFRRKLFNSRKDYVATELGRLNNQLYHRSIKIAELESERKKIFDELSSQKALDDLTNAYTKLATKQKELSEIDVSLKNIEELKQELDLQKEEHSTLLQQIPEYLESIKPLLLEFRNSLHSVYQQLFLDSHNIILFELKEIIEKQRLKFSVLEGSIIDSTGINQVRTLIYDITVLNNIISKGLNAPRFIIHDGIFENLDKSHFFAFIKYIDELLAKDTEFQYILTLNDHDFLDEVENFKQNKILDNSIIKLTPQKTLLGKAF
jgi:uncharacterized protein YydD (DUF2326 family)